MVVFRPLVARMVCLPTGAVVGASCVLFYQSGRRSRHPRVPSTGKASILSCEFLLFSRTNSRALGIFYVLNMSVIDLRKKQRQFMAVAGVGVLRSRRPVPPPALQRLTHAIEWNRGANGRNRLSRRVGHPEELEILRRNIHCVLAPAYLGWLTDGDRSASMTCKQRRSPEVNSLISANRSMPWILLGTGAIRRRPNNREHPHSRLTD